MFGGARPGKMRQRLLIGWFLRSVPFLCARFFGALDPRTSKSTSRLLKKPVSPQILHEEANLESVMLRRLIMALRLCPRSASRFVQPTPRRVAPVPPLADSGVPSWGVTVSCRAASSIAFGQTPTERQAASRASSARAMDSTKTGRHSRQTIASIA